MLDLVAEASAFSSARRLRLRRWNCSYVLGALSIYVTLFGIRNLGLGACVVVDLTVRIYSNADGIDHIPSDTPVRLGACVSLGSWAYRAVPACRTQVV